MRASQENRKRQIVQKEMNTEKEKMVKQLRDFVDRVVKEIPDDVVDWGISEGAKENKRTISINWE